MRRKDGWRTRLLAKMAEQERQPGIYGESDCLLRLSDTVEVMLDIDFGAPFRGQYTTLEGGYRALKKAGFKGPIEFLTSPDGCGFTEIHHSEAMDGDIGAVLRDGHWAFGHIVDAYFFPALPTGTAILPRSRAEKAFRVD